ncbi:MAG: alpha/beta hydrolase [Dehalococcoidia bacterium]|nr:alpha/beta hydrolase [Dehalococcoidia bacterium]
MPFADAAGVKIYYEVLGAGDPLIMLQGFGQYSLQWGGLPDEFVKLQYQVILIDNRGTGRSDKPDAPVTVVGMADDVCAVMDAISLKRSSLFGVSMGGMIAQEFAINHADRLNNLVLGCTTPGGPNSIPPMPVGARVLFDFDYMKNMTPEQRSSEVFRLFCSEDFIQENPDALKKYHEATIKYPTPLFIFARQAEAVSKFDTWDRLEKIKSPTMIISGTFDHIVPFKNSELLKHLIPHSELTLLQDKRHGFFIEAMDSTRIFINGFMKRHGKR